MESTRPLKLYLLPEDHYPFLIEAIHPETGEVVWELKVERPSIAEQVSGLYIPPLVRRFGHPVNIRIKYANGTQTP